MNQKLIAFWGYDLFPYILSGEVVEMNEEGRVETKEYGKGYWFKPKKLMPLKAGREVAARLKALCEEYDAAQKKLREEFEAQATEVFGDKIR